MLFHDDVQFKAEIDHDCERAYASLNRVSIDSDNGLSPFWRQAII